MGQRGLHRRQRAGCPGGGAEAGRKLVLSSLAGNNLIHDLGYLENGKTSSLALLAMCHEMAGQVRRFLQGVPVSSKTLAMEAIAQVGPGGHYLNRRETRDHHRRQIWKPELFTRKGHDAWLAEGATDTWQRARDKVCRIIASHTPRPLDPRLEEQIDAVLAKCGRG